jgi:glycerol-3-phosphate dehydrogenase (NAD(P)+)
MPPPRFVVIGGGSWGTAFANVLASRSHTVSLAMRDAAAANTAQESRKNTRYLPGVTIADTVRCVPLDPERVLAGVDVVVLAVPSRAFATICRDLASHMPATANVLSLTKGLEPDTGRRLSVVAADLLGCGSDRVAVLSGPNHAEEIARGTPAATVIASHSMTLAERLQELVGTPRLRVYANGDVIGVELCAAAKNVIALAAGVSDGLAYGDNAKAALITRGLVEMTRLGGAFHADPRTFAGLAGLGDLVATCCSTLSRNRRAGELLALGADPSRIEAQIGMVAEGLVTAPTLALVAQAQNLELPITERVCAVLAGEQPAAAVAALMARDPISEY